MLRLSFCVLLLDFVVCVVFHKLLLPTQHMNRRLFSRKQFVCGMPCGFCVCLFTVTTKGTDTKQCAILPLIVFLSTQNNALYYTTKMYLLGLVHHRTRYVCNVGICLFSFSARNRRSVVLRTHTHSSPSLSLTRSLQARFLSCSTTTMLCPAQCDHHSFQKLCYKILPE